MNRNGGNYLSIIAPDASEIARVSKLSIDHQRKTATRHSIIVKRNMNLLTVILINTIHMISERYFLAMHFATENSFHGDHN